MDYNSAGYKNGKPEFLSNSITYIQYKQEKTHLMSLCLFISEACFEMFPSTLWSQRLK